MKLYHILLVTEKLAVYHYEKKTTLEDAKAFVKSLRARNKNAIIELEEIKGAFLGR